MLWVLLFLGIAVGGLLVLVLVSLRVWRSARALLHEVDVMGARAGQLADLLAQIRIPVEDLRFSPDLVFEEAWPGTVETYDDAGAMSSQEHAPGKKDS